MSGDKTREAISRQVARILREERLRQGFSMDALAQKANLSQSMISFIERDMRNPSLDILLRMTDALNVRLEDVIRRARAAVEKGRSG